jgi:putative ABC transport system permease protein
MFVILKKVLRDLVKNWNRTVIVVISTTIGIFALGLVNGLSDHMTLRMTEEHQKANAAHITFQGGVFSEDFIKAVSQDDYISEITGEKYVPIRWRYADDEEWHRGTLVSRDDYLEQSINLIELLHGEWPRRRTFGVERQTATVYELDVEQALVIQYGRSEREITINGQISMPNVVPPQFGGDPTFFATNQTSAWLTGITAYNILEIRIDPFSEEIAKEVAGNVVRRINRMDMPNNGYFISDPDTHWLQHIVDTIVITLTALGILALFLSSFLIINTLNAIIQQEIWQIGVMKVLGATSKNIIGVYLLSAVFYSVLSILIAIPTSIISVNFLSGYLLDMINIEVGVDYVTWQAVQIQVIVGLLVPIISALLPVVRGSKITPYEAISSYGIGMGFGQSRVDKWISAIRNIPRPFALSLRNTFRRKRRVILTLFALVLGGALFITVMSLGTSLDNTLEVLINDLGLDIWVVFDRPYHSGYLEEIASQVPGVRHAEVWDSYSASLILDEDENTDIYLFGLPAESQIFSPRITEGRPLDTNDGNAILLNSKIAEDEDIKVGDIVELTIQDRASNWTVVGLVLSVSENQTACFVPLEALGYEASSANRGKIVMLLSENDTIEFERGLIEDVRDTFTMSGLPPAFLTSAREIREQNQAQFGLILNLLMVMAFLAALIGSIGLMGSMSINVLERRREIGVMRAIGARSLTIVGIFMSEGVFLGVISWLIAIPFSIPGAMTFSNIVGINLLRLPLDFQYSFSGMLIWLIVVIILSAFASFWPALQATKVSVRETLAYE